MVLNAGASGKEPNLSSQGVEMTYASTLVGHHVLTMGALAEGLLAPGARIVIAGSEAARGNLPGTKIPDIDAIAEAVGGDPVAAIEALFRLEAPAQQEFANMTEYATAKLIVAWWAAALARRLPEGMTVNAVSPGSAPWTSFARDAPAAMRYLMMPMMKLLGPIMGMGGSKAKAARRYVDAAAYADHETGHFYATEHRKKLVGPVAIQTWPAYFTDERLQEAALAAVVKTTGVAVPTATPLDVRPAGSDVASLAEE